MKESNKNKIQNVIIIVFAVLLIISFVKIHDLSEQIEQINDNFTYREQEFRNQINSIYANVDNKLNAQASLFSEYSYEDGKFYSESNTAELIIKLTPKTLTDDMTICITVDGKEIPFQRNGNTFTGKITADAFKYYNEKPVVNIKTAEETKTQVLDDIYLEYLYHNHLGSLTAHSTLSCSYSKFNNNSKNEKTITLDGFVILYYSNPKISADNIKKSYIVTELNGKEIDKKDITSKMEFNEYEFCADVPYSKSFTAKNNDTFEVYAVVEDSYGYTHKYLVDSQQITEDGSGGDFSAEELIYDKNGNLLNK